MSERLEGFGERVQRLNPLWQLGRGMSVGVLGDYVQMLSLALFLEVFYRELDNNALRTRGDLIDIIRTIAAEMQLGEITDSEEELPIERLVDGLLWYKDPELQQPFSAIWFDEKRQVTDTQRFRFFREDRHHSQWDKGGKTVYQLTEEALEIIFMSRELLQELEISIDQLYIQQQMKRGNFRKALRGLDDLLARVRRLIREEEDYGDDIRRNPKLIFGQGAQLRSKRESEIRTQFEEEKRRFDELTYTLLRLNGAAPEEIGRLQERIESTRQVHDRLAQLVLGNLSLELELRVKFPHLFWLQSSVTFRRSYWEGWLLEEGVPEPEHLELLLQPLFSPQPTFIYPLEWAWEEQETTLIEGLEKEFDEDGDSHQEEIILGRQVNWTVIADLWQPIIAALCQGRPFALSSLRDAPKVMQEQWVKEREALDLWLMFYGTPLRVPELESGVVYSDDRIVLLQKLFLREPSVRVLENRTIIASLEQGQPMVRWEGVVITPFILKVVKEGEQA